MLKESQLVSIFCEIDDFCKELDKNMPQPLLTSPTKITRGNVSDSAVAGSLLSTLEGLDGSSSSLYH